MIFKADSVKQLAKYYPATPCLLHHTLLDNPLFTLERLVELAGALPAANVEYNRGNVPLTQDPNLTPSNGLSPQETVRSIEQNGSWLVLKNVEQDTSYRALLEDLLGEIDGITHKATGPMYRKEAFIFISSPGSITPFHMDPEHNILMQIRGNKTMTVYPARDASILTPQMHESYHAPGGHRNLHHDPAFDAKAKPHKLLPGDAIHMPVKAPHWVQNGNEVSISLSITWRSNHSIREAEVQRMNGFLRAKGMNPMPVGNMPLIDRIKSLIWRTSEKLGLVH